MLGLAVTLLSSSLTCICTETARFDRDFIFKADVVSYIITNVVIFRMYIMRMFLTELGCSWFLCSRTGFSVTSTAGSLTPETVDLGTDLDELDGRDSRKSRSYRGSAIIETPRHPKRKYAIVPAQSFNQQFQRFCIIDEKIECILFHSVFRSNCS